MYAKLSKCDLGSEGVRSEFCLELYWKKYNFCLLVQGDGRHHNDTLVVIVLEALTSVNYLMGRSSWSPCRVGWDGCHWDGV